MHGTSAHVSWSNGGKLSFFSGGENHEKFVKLFNSEALISKFQEIGQNDVIIYGEAYGGKCQGMSNTYGKELKFIAFDVKIGESWLSVPQAEDFVKGFNIEFVHYVKVNTDLKSLDAERDAFSVQAVRNGCGNDKLREGVVLRPLIELTKNNGGRIICKHKGAAFSETKTPREVNPEKAQWIRDAENVAKEWVTLNRLNNVLSHLPEGEIKMENMWKIINLMVEDVKKEDTGEIVWNREVEKAIGKETAIIFKKKLMDAIKSVAA